MALIERLLNQGGTFISPEHFACALSEWVEGALSSGDIETMFDLDTEDSDEFALLLAEAPDDLSGITGLLAPLEPLVASPKRDWAYSVRSILVLGLASRYTIAQVRSRLGLPEPE